ncbi:BTB/POZ domain-containing protein [Morus notabilis]|uniref:BTB/POZ domain-containing protein n=1 Tax=Morus notabilis TaxID=981085 RepID=W9RQC4_9ROSA|nr:BTB/POZ domain-containing protein [Morus notabilis]
MPGMEGAAGENQEEEAVAMVEESPSDTGVNMNPLGDEAAHSDDSSWSMDCSAVLGVKSIHISSAILAAKSPFFYKLFSNGMRESERRNVTLRIHSSEEAALVDLLNFMYSNTLPVRTPSAILDVLMAADKFEVASCMRYCSRLLRDLPMTRESALLYLDLPSSVLMADAVQPLIEVAKQFLAGLYKDITKFQDDLLSLLLLLLRQHYPVIASRWLPKMRFSSEMGSDPLPTTRRTARSHWLTTGFPHSFSVHDLL